MFPPTVHTGSFFSMSSPTLVISSHILTVAILTDMKGDASQGVFVCISLIGDVEQLFMHLLAICSAFLETCLFSSIVAIELYKFFVWQLTPIR